MGEHVDTPPSTPRSCDLSVDEVRFAPTWRAITRVAVPSSINNVAAPLLTTLQTSLLGHNGGAVALAAFGSVSTTISLATRLATFLVDGTSAKCGAAIGERDWSKLAANVRHALSFALLMGTCSVISLFALKSCVLKTILRLDEAVLQQAELYWSLALLKVFFVLINLSISGALQGFRRTNAVAASTSIWSLLEFVLDCLAVFAQPERALLWVGIVGIVVAGLQTMFGFYMLFSLRPVEADEEFSLFQRLIEGNVQDEESDSGHNSDSVLKFFKDGTDMLIRSLVMQGTFAVALVCVSRLASPTTALAAHHVVTNIWMLVSYLVDGYAAAAIVLGSRLRAQAETSALTALTLRCLLAGLAAGLIVGCGLLVARESVLDFYIGNEGDNDVDKARKLLRNCWYLLCAVQPLNGLVFTIDGLLCAGRDFVYIRKCYVYGFVVVFLPAIALLKSSLLGVWITKAIFNVWRLTGGLVWLDIERRRLR